jgi:adenosine deaminase
MNVEPPSAASQTNRDIQEFVRALPKAELHVHLEGSVRPRTLLELAGRHRIDLGVGDEAGLRARYQFTDFPAFVRTYVTVCDCLRSGEDFALITQELGHDAARQNIHYLEATFTAVRHVQATGLTFDEVMDGIAAGAAAAQGEYGVTMRFIPDYPRDFGVDGLMQTVEWAIAGMDRGVVALGLSGMENEVPSLPFAPAVARAKAAGLYFAPHAGEIAGPQVVRDCIAMGADRIGHGIHAADDPALMEELRALQIPLEVCPTSNLRTGAVTSLADHPLRRLWEAGDFVTLNSDDPPMFNTDLVQEYALAGTAFGFSAAELARLSLNGARAAFLPAADKAALVARFEAELGTLGVPLS